jgi:hypothetical protein
MPYKNTNATSNPITLGGYGSTTALKINSSSVTIKTSAE